MKIDLPVKIHNKFEFYMENIKTKEEKLAGTAYNIVLDNFINGVLLQTYSGYRVGESIAIGKGTGQLDPTRTQLFSYLFSRDTTLIERNWGFPVSYATFMITIQPEELVGETLTEVGLQRTSGSGTNNPSSNSLITHALIEDSEGHPISILKTETDILKIYATIYFEFGAIDPAYEDKIKWVTPASNNIIARVALGELTPDKLTRDNRNFYLGDSDWRPPSDSDEPTLSSRGQVTEKSSSPVIDTTNKKITWSIRFGATEGNSYPVRNIGLANIANIQLPCPGVWEEFLITNESVGIGDGVKKEFPLKWDGIIDGSLNVKINGNPVTQGFTVYPRREIFDIYPRRDINHDDILYTVETFNDLVVVMSYNKMHVYRIDPNDMYPRKIQDYDINVNINRIVFSTDGTLIQLGNAIYDFNPATGELGAKYVYANDTVQNDFNIGRDHTKLMTKNGKWFLNSSSGIKSYSINRTSKVIGEQIYTLSNWPYNSETYNIYSALGDTLIYIHRIRYGSSSSSSNYYYGIYAAQFDPISGIWGNNTDNKSSDRYIPISFSNNNFDGEVIIIDDKWALLIVGNYTPIMARFDENLNYINPSFDFSQYNNLDYKDTLNISIKTFKYNGKDYLIYGTHFNIARISLFEFDWEQNKIIYKPNFFLRYSSSFSRNDLDIGVTILPNNKIIIIANQNNDNYKNIKFFEYAEFSKGNIVFDTPPSLNDVITADYKIPYIPKNDEYVLDLTFGINFGVI